MADNLSFPKKIEIDIFQAALTRKTMTSKLLAQHQRRRSYHRNVLHRKTGLLTYGMLTYLCEPTHSPPVVYEPERTPCPAGCARRCAGCGPRSGDGRPGENRHQSPHTATDPPTADHGRQVTGSEARNAQERCKIV